MKSVLRGAGLLVILAAIVWVGFLGFKNAPSVGRVLSSALAGIQSLFTPAERIVISVVDNQIVVNEPFTLTWEHRGKDTDGSYTFSYECRDDVHLTRKGDDGLFDTVFCNMPLPILADDTLLTLTAAGEVNGVIDIPVRVSYTENNSVAPAREGVAILSVQETRFDDATSTTTTDDTALDAPLVPVQPSRPVTYVPAVTTPDLFGKADLTVSVLAYGLVNTKTGEFEAVDEIPYNLPSGKRGAIQFEVQNIGTNVSPEWRFEAELPTSPSYTYRSDDQQALFPQDRIVFTIGFTKVRKADEDTYRIEIDSENDVDESNENNNVETGSVQIDR